MGTFIRNKNNISELILDPNKMNILIRITNPGGEFTDLKNPDQFTDILELRFFDFTQEQNGLQVFDDNHLEKILSFFEKYKNAQNFVVHCDYGISRSAGIAVGWLMYHDNRHEIYKIYHNRKHIPNRLIVDMFAKKLNLSVKYIDKWEKEKFEGLE